MLLLLLSKLFDYFALFLIDHADTALQFLISLLLSIHDVLDRLLYLEPSIVILHAEAFLHLVGFLDVFAYLISGCLVYDGRRGVDVANGWQSLHRFGD